VLAPVLAFCGGVAILVGLTIAGRGSGSLRIPVLVVAAVAVVLSATMLALSLDAGSGPQCPDGRCGEQSPTTTVTEPG
jgi:hypothetical protein